MYEHVNKDLVVLGDTKCSYCKEGIQLLKGRGTSFRIFYIDQDPSVRKAFDTLKVDGVPVLISRK
ncbi:glutaredoxin domain-containing protein [Undibacterium cyanobacteriorum]|uniref:glutaredoxin domain-containing protein n=1 Tax=Undibacterium cyanobacteriorum TaxID=3073561 RepID=UPI0035A3C566